MSLLSLSDVRSGATVMHTCCRTSQAYFARVGTIWSRTNFWNACILKNETKFLERIFWGNGTTCIYCTELIWNGKKNPRVFCQKRYFFSGLFVPTPCILAFRSFVDIQYFSLPLQIIVTIAT